MKKILVITGEESGDKQFSLFWREISPFLSEDYLLWGIGGNFFTSIGGEVVFPQENLSVMGVTEVLFRARDILEAGKRILSHPYLTETSGVVLVDFPDFNFRIGKLLAGRGYPVIYFIPPKVWAWRRGRIKVMKKFVKLALLIFPFESELYSAEGIENIYVGNPAIRYLGKRLKSAARDSVLLLPGSRNFEVEKLLPIMLRTVKVLDFYGYKLKKKLILASSVDRTKIVTLLTEAETCGEIVIVDEKNLVEVLPTGRIAIAASGTINLELAVAGVPQVVVYRVSPLTFAIGKRFVKLSHVSPVNIVAGREVVPELLQDECNEKRIVEKVLNFLDNEELVSRVRSGYEEVTGVLSSGVEPSLIASKVEEIFEKKGR